MRLVIHHGKREKMEYIRINLERSTLCSVPCVMSIKMIFGGLNPLDPTVHNVPRVLAIKNILVTHSKNER